jgi:hypothetical protein
MLRNVEHEVPFLKHFLKKLEFTYSLCDHRNWCYERIFIIMASWIALSRHVFFSTVAACVGEKRLQKF